MVLIQDIWGCFSSHQVVPNLLMCVSQTSECCQGVHECSCCSHYTIASIEVFILGARLDDVGRMGPLEALSLFVSRWPLLVIHICSFMMLWFTHGSTCLCGQTWCHYTHSVNFREAPHSLHNSFKKKISTWANFWLLFIYAKLFI